MKLPLLVNQLRTLYSSFYRFSPLKVMLLHLMMLLRSLSGSLGILLIIPLLMAVGVDLSSMHGNAANENIASFFASFDFRPGLAVVLGIYLALMFLISALNYQSTVLASALQQSFTSTIRLRLYRALLKADWRYVVSQRMSEFTRLLTDQVYTTGAAVYQVLSLIGQLIMVTTYLVLSAILSPALTLIAILCGVFLLGVLVPLTRRIRSSGHLQLDLYKEIYQLVGEQLNGLKLIKSHVAEDRYINRLSSSSDLLESQELELTRINALSQWVHFFGAALVFSALFYVAIQYIEVPTSTLVILLFIFSRLLPQISGIQTTIQRLHHQAPAYEDLLAFQASADASQEVESGEGRQVQIVSANIQFQDLLYTHGGASRPVFRSLNATIPVNTTVAITGCSGVGKSTLADILAGLLRPQSGAVLLDGNPLQPEEVLSWRQQVAYVTQDIFLFHDSVRNNLLAVTSDPQTVTDARLWHALELSAAAEFVAALPLGLDTVIGDRGIRISGGERQRLAIARALLTEPRLLILDESTSALDSHNVGRISKALETLRGRMTIVVIAHNETSVVQVDQEICVEDFAW